LTLDDTAIYLLGQVFGFVLGLRGVTCLHASVVAIQDQAIAVMGPAGAGKSTIAAALARWGYPVMADDIAALTNQEGRFVVQPGYPRLRLWPSSVDLLFGSPAALPRITPTWEKCHLDLTSGGYHFQARPLPLAAIYYLCPRGSGPDVPSVAAMTGEAAFMAMIANTYAAQLFDQSHRTRAFELFGRLRQEVAIRRVTPHEDPRRLPELCDLILADFGRSNG
jgi:hypothetical protein